MYPRITYIKRKELSSFSLTKKIGALKEPKSINPANNIRKKIIIHFHFFFSGQGGGDRIQREKAS